MADITQASVEVLAHQEITHPASVVGGDIAVATYLSGVLYVYQANIETTANLAGGLDYIDVQTSPDAAGNNWASYRQLVPSTTASSDEVFTATEPIGEKVFAVAATAGFDASDQIYLKDMTSVATSEWAQVQSIVANTSITAVDGLIVAKVAGDVLNINVDAVIAEALAEASIPTLRADSTVVAAIAEATARALLARLTLEQMITFIKYWKREW